MSQRFFSVVQGSGKAGYLFSVHAQVGGSSRHRDTSLCQFDEVLLNPTGNLERFHRKTVVNDFHGASAARHTHTHTNHPGSFFPFLAGVFSRLS